VKIPAPALRFWPLILLAPIAYLLWMQHKSDTVEIQPVVCATLASGCTVQLADREIRLGMTGELKPLSPFQVWVQFNDPAQAAAVNKAEARFVMEGMDMGFNLYSLRPDADGVLRANVTLPICVTGRRDWAMILEIDNLRLSIPFVTDL